MIFPLFVQKTPANFGGPRAGSQCQELFANLPKFSTIIVPVAQTCLICDNLLHSCKKDLTRDPVAGIMARAPLQKIVIALLLAQETCKIFFICTKRHQKKFCPHPQKRLDNRRVCTYSGARPTKRIVVALLLAPPRQKSCQVKPCYLKKR